MSLFKGRSPIASNRSINVAPPEDIQDRKCSVDESSDNYDTALSKIKSGGFMREILTGIKRCLKLAVRKEDVLTLEEIEASTGLTGKVAGADAVKRLNSELRNKEVIGFFKSTANHYFGDGTDLSFSKTDIVVDFFYENDTLPLEHGLLITIHCTDLYIFQICTNYEGIIYTRIKWGTWKDWIIRN